MKSYPQTSRTNKVLLAEHIELYSSAPEKYPVRMSIGLLHFGFSVEKLSVPPGEKEHFHEGKIQTAFKILLDPTTLSQQVFLLFTRGRWCCVIHQP